MTSEKIKLKSESCSSHKLFSQYPECWNFWVSYSRSCLNSTLMICKFLKSKQFSFRPKNRNEKLFSISFEIDFVGLLKTNQINSQSLR